MNIGFDAKRIFHNRTGLGNYGRDLVRMMGTYYPEHTYYLYNPKPAKQSLFIPPAAHIVERLPQSAFGRLFHPLWRQRGMVRDLKRDDIPLFHGLSGELPIGLSAQAIKGVVTIHDLIFVRFPELYRSIDRSIYFRKFRYAAHHADRIIAISKQTKQDIVDFLGVEGDKIAVVYQGCHPAFKQRYTEEEKLAVRKKYQLPEEFILNVGTIETRKNALAIVKAIAPLDVHLVIAGKPTPYLDELKAYIGQHKLFEKVSFIHGAPTDELAKLYQSALLFVYPSLFEGFGIPIVEALYSGVPVVSTAGGCFSEAGGPHSRYVSPHDIAEITDAIHTILTDSTLRQQMVERGISYSRNFNDERIADQLMHIYHETVIGC